MVRSYQRPTAGVSCVWAGVDSAWEQEKLEARKMLVNAAESHTSGARFVGRRFYINANNLTSEFIYIAPVDYFFLVFYGLTKPAKLRENN